VAPRTGRDIGYRCRACRGADRGVALGHRGFAAGWMTPRFVAHSWDVPPEVVWQSLMLGPDGPARRITLAELAKAQNIPLPLLLEELRADIAAHRAELAP